MKQTILVTGGTKGIGRAIINLFVENGFEAIVCARSQSDLDKMKEFNENLITFQADLSLRKDRESFAQFLKDKHVDVLVNNAGIFIPGEILEEPSGNLSLMVETNLYSAYDMIRAVVPGMVERKKGHIFNMCSIASITAYANGGSYSISKFAMYGMSKVLREEMKDKQVKVTSILPGATFTASWEGVEVTEERLMPAEDVAKSVWDCYNMSDRTNVEELIIRPQLGDL